ncbi:uncharacterized protein LOC144447734 [Glandiceps talaboti]
MSLDPFHTYLLDLSGKLSEDDLANLVTLTGGLTPSVTRADRENILKHGGVNILFEKLRALDHLSKNKCDVLIQLLRNIDRKDLSAEVKTRYELGFDREVADDDIVQKMDERKRSIEMRRLKKPVDDTVLIVKSPVRKQSRKSSPVKKSQQPEQAATPTATPVTTTKTDIKKAEKDLLKSGRMIKTKRGRVMIVGQFGVGKTSLKRSLFKEEFNPKHDVTKGIDTVRFSIDISNFFSKDSPRNKGSPTQMVLRKLIADKLQALLRERPSENTVKTTPNPVRVEDGDKIENITQRNNNDENSPLIRQTSMENENEDHTGDDLQIPDLLSQLLFQGEDEKKVLEALNLNDLDIEIEIDKDAFYDFTLWDFAGQCVYYTTHQVFLENKSIFVLVADSSHDLDEECPVDQGESRGERQCWRKKMKYADYLTFWLNSIHACSKKSTETITIDGHEYKAPLVILVATKKDKLKDTTEQDEFLQDVRLHLAETCEEAFDAHVFHESFIVDNSKSGTDEEDPEIQKLRECLKSLADKPLFTDTVPVNWLRLELLLKGLRDVNKRVVETSFVENCAWKVGVKKEEMDLVLNYFHKTGTAYHFKDLLVLEARWLTSILGRVISLKLGDIPINHPRKERFLIDLRRHGILHKELLDFILDEGTTPKRKRNGEGDESGVVWYTVSDHGSREHLVREESKYHDAKIQLMDLLLNFDLVYQLTSDAYIVPSLLQMDKIETVPLREERNCHTIPLYYHFAGGFLPEGLYYRLVVRCLDHWKCDESHLKKNLRYHHARFSIGERHKLSLTKFGPDIIMIVWYSKFDRTFQSFHQKPDAKKCVEARMFVEEVLNEIIKTWMPSLRYDAKVRCSCQGHIDKHEGLDEEKWIGDNDDFVYHNVKVNPPYQVKKDDETKEMDFSVEHVKARKYTGLNRAQCKEMSSMMNMLPVRVWFGVSNMFMNVREFKERLPRLGVIAFSCAVVVFLWVFAVGLQSALYDCRWIYSMTGAAVLAQCVVIFVIILCAFAMATWLCIFYSRTDEEYRNVRALFLVVFSLMFVFLPFFTSEVAKIGNAEPCVPEIPTNST